MSSTARPVGQERPDEDRKPCERPGCGEFIYRRGRSRSEFARRKFHSRECAFSEGGQVRSGNPNGPSRRPQDMPDRLVAKRIAALLEPAPVWRPAGFAPVPNTRVGARS